MMVMKKIFVLWLAVSGIMQMASTQCVIDNPGIKLNYTVTDGNNCRINLDLYFDMIHNPGGKFAWIHIWPSNSYANWNYNNPPTLANGGLNGSIATIGIEHQQSSLVVQSTYPPDAGAQGIQFTGVTASEGPGILAGSERYTIKNINLLVPGDCNIPQSFTMDVWQSQSAQAQVVHCAAKGLVFFANDPRVTGLLNCNIPHTYTFVINTTSNTTIDVSYKVFIDNGDGIFNPAQDGVQVLSGTANLNPGNNYRYSSGVMGYLPYSAQKPEADRDLWLQVTSPYAPNAVYAHLTNGCIGLPVQLIRFTALRKNEMVNLSWTTSMEAGNKGFYIERLEGVQWQTIGFVASAALNGQSDAEISYTYADYNALTMVSQYRLKQVDLQGSFTYSAIRVVPGMELTGRLLVFPNPSPDGNLNIVANDLEGELFIRIMDMNGKLVQQWSRSGGQQLAIRFSKSGMYILQVQQKATGRTLNHKIVIAR